MDNNVESYDPVTFAQGLRAAYPGAFDLIKDDYALAQGFAQAHPEAAQHINFGPQHPTSQIEQGANPNQPFGTLNDLQQSAQSGATALQKETGLQTLPFLAKTAASTVPTTPTQAALTALGPALGVAAPEVEGAIGAAQKMAKPGLMAKLGGQGIATTARINPNFAASVLQDPSILTSETPSVKEVSDAMGRYFKAKGVQVDSDMLKEISGKAYFPSDNQVEQLRSKFVDPVLDKLEAVKSNVPNAVPPTEEELIFGERAANAISRSTPAQQNKYMAAYAAKAKSDLTSELTNAGYGQLPGLKQDYYRALAKESFEDFLPQNKQGSPNALSSLLMLKSFKDALINAATGNPGQAAVNAVQGATFSPYMIGAGIRGASSGLGALSGIPTAQVPLGLNAIFNRQNQQPPQ